MLGVTFQFCTCFWRLYKAVWRCRLYKFCPRTQPNWNSNSQLKCSRCVTLFSFIEILRYSQALQALSERYGIFFRISCNGSLQNTCPTKCKHTYATDGLSWSCNGVGVFALGWTCLAEACIAVPREVFYILGSAVWLAVLDTWLGSIANTSVIWYVVDARLNKASCESKWAFTDLTKMLYFITNLSGTPSRCCSRKPQFYRNLGNF